MDSRSSKDFLKLIPLKQQEPKVDKLIAKLIYRQQYYTRKYRFACTHTHVYNMYDYLLCICNSFRVMSTTKSSYNGAVQCSGSQVGDTCIFTCDDGFGSDYKICQSD